MGLTRQIVFIILILIAVLHFFPDLFESGRSWVLGKSQDVIDDKTSLNLDIEDLGKGLTENNSEPEVEPSG